MLEDSLAVTQAAPLPICLFLAVNTEAAVRSLQGTTNIARQSGSHLSEQKNKMLVRKGRNERFYWTWELLLWKVKDFIEGTPPPSLGQDLTEFR